MKQPILLTVACLLALSGCAHKEETFSRASQPAASPAPATPRVNRDLRATAELAPTAGHHTRGTVYFVAEPQGTRISGQITGLTPGEHGFHIHEIGDCSAPDASSAGDHFNPTSSPHGGPRTGMRHLGDLGNITAGADGVAHVSEVIIPALPFQGANSILGKALIVHAEADDITSQPSGNSGARIACGVIQAAR